MSVMDQAPDTTPIDEASRTDKVIGGLEEAQAAEAAALPEADQAPAPEVPAEFTEQDAADIAAMDAAPAAAEDDPVPLTEQSVDTVNVTDSATMAHNAQIDAAKAREAIDTIDAQQPDKGNEARSAAVDSIRAAGQEDAVTRQDARREQLQRMADNGALTVNATTLEEDRAREHNEVPLPPKEKGRIGKFFDRFLSGSEK